MKEMDVYEQLNVLLDTYKGNNKSSEGKDALDQLLALLRPLIISSARHYYGNINDDLVQDGYEQTIILLQKFDQTRTEVKLLGYVKRMLMCFYWGKKRRDIANENKVVSIDSVGDLPVTDNTSRLELEEILNRLPDKEKALVIGVYIRGEKLKAVSMDMGISYSYSKELLAKARNTLRTIISI